MKTQTTTKGKEKQPVAFAFYRISTDRQQSDRQVEDVRRYCQAMDISLPEENEFKETISGASKLKDRTELKRMLKKIDENPPFFVICSELSRLARSQDAVILINDWTNKGICFISLKENIRTLDKDGNKSPMTDLLLNIMTAINIFELSTIKYRVKSALRKTANAGIWNGGRAPYGYSLKDKRLVINDAEAQIVKRMFEMYANGISNMSIAYKLNIEQVKTKEGKTWTDVKMYKILSNTIYIGKRKWNDETIDQPELKIIDDSIFANVQKRLKNNLNTNQINKQNKYDYLLKHKIKCSCGKNFIGQGRDNTYMCKSRKYKAGCNIKSVGINWLDNEIKKRLMLNSGKLLFDNSGIINKRKDYEDNIKQIEERIKEQKTHQNYLANNIERLGQKMFETKFDTSTELVNKLQKELDDLNIKLSQTIGMIKNPVAIGVIDPARQNEVLNAPKGKRFGPDIFSKMIIDKELVRRVIDVIHIDNDNIQVNLINEKSFVIPRQ